MSVHRTRLWLSTSRSHEAHLLDSSLSALSCFMASLAAGTNLTAWDLGCLLEDPPPRLSLMAALWLLIPLQEGALVKDFSASLSFSAPRCEGGLSVLAGELSMCVVDGRCSSTPQRSR
jgi:hypothetical protein